MNRPPSAMRIALGLFTILPVKPVDEIDRSAAARAMAVFPWVGALLGILAGAALAGWPTRLAPFGGGLMMLGWLLHAIGQWRR